MPAVGKAAAAAAQAQPGPVRGSQEDSESSEESDSEGEAPAQVRPQGAESSPLLVLWTRSSPQHSCTCPSRFLILFLSLQAKPSGKTPPVETAAARTPSRPGQEAGGGLREQQRGGVGQ